MLQTIYFNSKQQIIPFLFKVIFFETKVLCHISEYSWKNSSRMPLSSVVMALLMAFKTSPFYGPPKEKNHSEPDKKNWEVFLLQQLSSRPVVTSVLLWWSNQNLSRHNFRLAHWMKYICVCMCGVCFGIYVSTYNSEKRHHWASKLFIYFNMFIVKKSKKMFLIFTD